MGTIKLPRVTDSQVMPIVREIVTDNRNDQASSRYRFTSNAHSQGNSTIVTDAVACGISVHMSQFVIITFLKFFIRHHRGVSDLCLI